MVSTKGKQVLFTFALMATLMVGVSTGFAQADPNGGRRGGGGRDFRNMSPEQREQMRQRMAERMEQRRAEQAKQLQAELSLSDEEFAAVSPMIEKIRQLTRERMWALRPTNDGPGGDRRFGGFPGFGQDDTEPSPQAKQLEEAAEQLRASLASDSASEQQIQDHLAAFRAAREQMAQAIATVQQQLKEVLLPKQEAVLVMHGVLE